ncbi:histidine phosphatase family protein [Hymenobacter sp. BT175]|uniref:SixA phosphatase family protein n=1 Tax=Hymenobacter translucens TaxID=2886507 RepID=UPI001D0F0B76|nr:phosphoglycerate mutase family protein [Hymenobacter translucens]MCC2544999.1 histidine phosphatase family protein [Hymenobacter translucens]
MRKPARPLLILLPLLALLLFGNCRLLFSGLYGPPSAIVYLVRHAEKDLTPGLADPLLTPAGEQRALALRDTLRRAAVHAILTTDTRRTKATVTPLAEARKLTPEIYDPKRAEDVAKLIRQRFQNKTVVIVGHSNTILPLIEAFGAGKPVPEIRDNEYDYLFRVMVPESGPAKVLSVSRYGASSAVPAGK